MAVETGRVLNRIEAERQTKIAQIEDNEQDEKMIINNKQTNFRKKNRIKTLLTQTMQANGSSTRKIGYSLVCRVEQPGGSGISTRHNDIYSN